MHLAVKMALSRFLLSSVLILSVQALDPVQIEFDESDVSKLQLKIQWNADKSLSPDKFVLVMEQKRFMGTKYTNPVLIDDETTIESSSMVRTRFKARVPLRRRSRVDCAMNCINSSKLILQNNETFDCNIFYYEPKYKICVLYQYDFDTATAEKESELQPGFNDVDNFSSMYMYFIDECEIDEILNGIHGYERYCRRLLQYKEIHTIKINPYVDYRFSLSVRGADGKWSPYSRKEYLYAPKISIDVKGDLKLGNNISIECKTDLHPSIIDSIQWKNANSDPKQRGILQIKSLNHYNIYQTYFCEIRYNQARMMQKAFKLNITEIEQNLLSTPPKLKMNVILDNLNLKVNINWTVDVGQENVFKPERIILLYSENYKPWKFVGKYLLFHTSKYDNIQFTSSNQTEEIVAKDEEECAMHCLQSSFCDHFVYRNIDPTKSSTQKNCNIAKNNYDNMIDCRLDSICATLASYKENIKNNSVSIPILPNVTYKFRLQLKDELFNWTNLEETANINLPLKLTVEQEGQTLLSESNNNSSFRLKCFTNLNSSVPIVLSWTKNGKELTSKNKLYSQTSLPNTTTLNSILEFKSLKKANHSLHGDIYKCKALYLYSDVGQSQGGVSYFSDPVAVKLTFIEPLKYKINSSNITMPTIPGLLFELSCQVTGNPRPKIKWLIDGVNYSEKKFESFTDEPFVINITFLDNWSMNHILVFKMDNPRTVSKYECILNDNITIRRHFIKVVDEKPQLAVDIDPSSLNDLEMKLELDVKHKNEEFLKGYPSKPLKMSIMYVENSTFAKMENLTSSLGFYEAIRIAPDTLSSDTISSPKKINRVPIATLKHAQRGMLSCKLLCFQTPFCQSYEHLVLENSCDLFSSPNVETYYNDLIKQVRNRSNSDFNLLHLLRGNILSVLQEDMSFVNKRFLSDTKSIARTECESRLTTAEIHCNDELFTFNESYTFRNLTPGTSYQFKLQVANVFGKSNFFVTKTIEVPFPLNPITERINQALEHASTEALICSTPLRKTQNLKFRWYKNEQLITSVNNQLEQFQTSKNNLYTSELRFRVASSQLNGYYTCVLDYSDAFMAKSASKNVSIIFRSKSGPFFTTYQDVELDKPTGSSWSASCSAEGWPLPSVEWFFNGKAIPNVTDNDLLNPHIINHHRHLTATSYIIVNKFSQEFVGRYSCYVNGHVSIKNITVNTVSSNNDNSRSNEENSSGQKSKDEVTKERISVKSILIPLFILVCFVVLATLCVYSYLQKRKRSNSDTSLSYNRIQEEVMAGVDNPNLIDEETTADDRALIL